MARQKPKLSRVIDIHRFYLRIYVTMKIYTSRFLPGSNRIVIIKDGKALILSRFNQGLFHNLATGILTKDSMSPYLYLVALNY